MTTNEIADIIIQDMCRRSFPVFLTHYAGQGMQEVDVFGINKNGYMYEYEIKRSRSDFQAEFRNKQDKHRMLVSRDAIKVYAEWYNGKRTGDAYELIKIPNRYYFLCPDKLIKPEEVPDYAGLIYADKTYMNGLREMKKAPLLHRNKANDRIYKRVATILSQRIVFGCSYYTHQFNIK